MAFGACDWPALLVTSKMSAQLGVVVPPTLTSWKFMKVFVVLMLWIRTAHQPSKSLVPGGTRSLRRATS